MVIKDCRYDVVIVGAGPSAMGLLYGLLLPYTRKSNHQGPLIRPTFTIAIIDRGEDSTRALHQSIVTRDPKRWGYAAFNSMSSTVIYTRPQVGLNHRRIGVPVGKGVGGTSNINACLVCQPHADDFETISSTEDNIWTADVMLPATKEIESVIDSNGGLSRHRNCLLSNYEKSFDAQRQICPPDIALLVKKANTNTHIRSNYYEALIQPLLEANPHLCSSISFHNTMLVERIIFSPSQDVPLCKATAVECSYRGPDRRTLYCRVDALHSVVLCGGAIYSPALLLASGLGDSFTLKKARIVPLNLSGKDKVESNACGAWKGIGKGLHDHIILPRFFLIRPKSWNHPTETAIALHDPLSTKQLSDPESSLSVIGKISKHQSPTELVFQSSVNGVQGWVHEKQGRCLIKVFDGSATPWLIPEMVFSTLHRSYIPMFITYFLKKILELICLFYPVRYFIQNYTQVVAVCLMNPKSRGSITLVRKGELNEEFSPSISRLSDFDIDVDPAYLTHPEDIECLRHGWNTSERWISQQQYSLEILPGLYKHSLPSPRYHKWFTSYASNFANPYYHWSGSLAMKHQIVHDKDVVDEEDTNYVLGNDFKVRDTENVYVCCASAFPKPISVPTALSCSALGYVLATRQLNTKLSTMKKDGKEKFE